MNILAFNRPHYLERVLKSLQDQTVRIDQSRITVWIDGYSGSKDAVRLKRNRTEQTLEVAKKFLPNASFIVRNKNVGIAGQYHEAELASFSIDSDIAFFFEEDLVLSPRYLEALLQLESLTRGIESIGRISAHGYGRGHAPVNSTIGVRSSMRTWGFGLRRHLHLASQPYLDVYMEIINQKPYWRRDANAIFSEMKALGVNLGSQSSSQDSVKGSIAKSIGISGITTNARLAKYIGKTGEHKMLLSSLTKRRQLFATSIDDDFSVTAQDIHDFLETTKT
jgi:glycosyltransferase involved in cell wall biosynthesis